MELSENNRRFEFRQEDRTIYSEINHSVVGPPPLSSSSEDEDDGNGNGNDDFMTLDEITEMMEDRS